MAVISGKEYIRRIDRLNSNIWIEGRQISGPISKHAAFSGAVKSQALLYDLQKCSEHESLLIHKDCHGRSFGTSFIIPKTRKDLEKKREMVQLWARHTGGLMGRSPDYMNTVLAAFRSSIHLLEGEENCFPENIVKLYDRAIEKDLSFTHTFINPQCNRGSLAFMDEDPPNARTVDRTEDGIIVSGAKLLATQGGMTDEIIVYSPPGLMDKDQAFAFSLPADTKGLTFACRKPFSGTGERFDSPLSSRFEEMDSLVIFDRVLVPWERIFYYDNNKIADHFFKQSHFASFALHQVVSRQIVKTEFILGVAQLIVDTINISEYEHVQLKITEIICGLECVRALLGRSESEAEKDERGVLVPAAGPLYVAVSMFQKSCARFTEIIQILGASGMICLPDKAQFDSPIGEDLNRYLRGFNINGRDRVELFSLASDLCMSHFGSRQTLYERFFFGDPVRLSQSIYRSYDSSIHKELVKKFL
ncbi:4-hydroxyphenylacetate 3-hydroxylase family protein [Alteribacter natronophilus]|uniref:4-hydroxyphenylacetate 3-hydroxylase family protein n=1 Tax=Alteribacter natronophilus TaxID=2583810 RepID=UPI00110E6668|nr:4-hydroxyphenylacetate 3-hydroxylase N-terminal domain-containing protein [Alteribacter natronophilus]TMW71659.1 4-hydroxyphenylacetate 3-monooxygenase [Alteribacter natronophilus]